ncbi:MAG: hypothetical protein HYS17_11920 [Micavibrio aeruginosavorus]|uniref:Lipoprotein n=1 Tax=Micavibrio aeruginosavorus TaxID=349221 RepID=A0A7T5R2D1_9BACT|nr:MAG: hypothetical protein HYS17_11920 [Micavibrio aeruginosavorus]
MKYVFILLTSLMLLGCTQVAVPDDEIERMRASMPPERDPPAAYNRQGLSVP